MANKSSMLRPTIPGLGRRPSGPAYVFAVAVTLATLLARIQLGAVFAQRPLLILFVLPIILSAYVGGLWSGLVSTLVACVSVDYFLIPPIHSLQIAETRDFIQWLILIVNGVLISVLSESLHRSQRRLQTAATEQKQAEATLQKAYDELRQRCLEGAINFYAPEARPVIAEAVQKAIAEGAPYDLELPSITAIGKRLWVRARGRPEFHDGKCTRLSGTFQDITARKQAEAEVKRSHALIATLNEVGSRLQTSLEFNRVLEMLGGGLKQLGFTCCLSLIDSTLGTLVTIYNSIDPAATAQAEHLLGFPIQGYSQPLEDFFLTGNLNKHRLAMFIPNALPTILAALPGLPRPALEQALAAVGLLPDQPILFIPLIANNEVIGVMAVWGAALQKDDVPALSIFAAQAGAAIQNARLFEAVYKSHKQLEALSHRLVEVQETERRDLARELHDEIGQVLTGIRLVLEMAAQSPAATMTHLTEAQTLVGRLIKQVQRLSLDLRPTMLDDLGLLPTLLWHFERYTAQTGVRVTFEHARLNRRFDPLVETAAYRIVQEALTNVARHAGVNEVTVRAWVNGERLGVQIADDGAGFNADTALVAGGSTGLSGMRERTTLLGGRWSLESAPGAGTRVTAKFPVSVRAGQALDAEWPVS